MIERFCYLKLMVLLLVAAGCGGGPRPVTGGTAGELHAGGDPLGDIQVTVHQIEGTSFEAIGFAATRADGSFELVTPGAAGPLRLTPGEYCCTLESVGAPITIPREYTRAETTPLKVNWEPGDTNLELELLLKKNTR